MDAYRPRRRRPGRHSVRCARTRPATESLSRLPPSSELTSGVVDTVGSDEYVVVRGCGPKTPTMDDVIAGTGVRPQMNTVMKALKRENNSLWSCCNSVLEDERFVAEIRQLYSTLPLVANLRCGLWYAPRFDATCYFKSTDGHNGWWNFSTTRLNAALAELAAARGGAVIVDATRMGKRFPDSLTKTIPIWACVLNRAVARVRAHDARREAARRSLGECGGGPGQSPPSAAAAEWDTDLHLPLWVAPNERKQIEAKLEGWVERLLSAGADVRRLSALLQKPLRPLWISQASVIWTNAVAAPADLPFTPLVLVSASQPHHDGEGGGGGGGGGVGAWSYVYVPGAGDDEESWSHGLTPPLLWEHQERLLAAGPGGIQAEARRLLLRYGGGGGGGGTAAGGGGPRMCGEWQRERAAERPRHALAPRGCEAAGAAAAGGEGGGAAAARAGAPVFWVGGTGMALGGAAAAAAPGVWRSVDAVLCLGERLPPSLQPEWRAG
ncbi:MAG: initiator tRNA phosphoribosyl transferase-domain-containing protein, partial [Monoraphidium minutum]